jgi:hypothetical protein
VTVAGLKTKLGQSALLKLLKRFTKRPIRCSLRGMSTVKEIEAAILALPAKERREAGCGLTFDFAGVGGGHAVESTHGRCTPKGQTHSPVDRLEAELKANPERYPEIRKKDFDERS